MSLLQYERSQELGTVRRLEREEGAGMKDYLMGFIPGIIIGTLIMLIIRHFA